MCAHFRSLNHANPCLQNDYDPSTPPLHYPRAKEALGLDNHPPTRNMADRLVAGHLRRRKTLRIVLLDHIYQVFGHLVRVAWVNAGDS